MDRAQAERMPPVPSAAAGQPSTVQVELVYCPAPSQLRQMSLRLPRGSTLAQAWAASGLEQELGGQAQALRLGIWGKVREPEHVLREGDRVEVYRNLQVDPKEARRLRYAQHKAKLASLGPPRIPAKIKAPEAP